VSRENVDLVRRSLDAYARRDAEAMRAITWPELELDWSRSRAWLAGVYRGFDEALSFYADYFEAFESIVIVPDCFIHAGDVVVAPNVAHQRGRDGVEVSARSALVFTVRDGKIARICLYQETEEALAAVGLTGAPREREPPSG
jgi:ketosteroid isomerase-like protein